LYRYIMTVSRPIAVVIDAVDPDALRDFWVAALGYEPFGKAGAYRSATPPEGCDGPKFVFQQVPEPPPTGKNRLHIDIIVGDEIEAETERLEALGATRLTELIADVGTSWIVLVDPEGNEFCLVYDT
jgi:predicted enzyme related to lactoylglutathione lyase